MHAVRLVRSGWSTRKVARYLGFSQSAIVKWMQKAQAYRRAQTIVTQSSKPRHHPHELSFEIVEAIIRYRLTYRRCAEVLHYLLKKDGYQVSLSSVKRTLRREGLIQRSPWKRWHQTTPRPEAKKPGILVQIDTIHIGPVDKERLYIYTLLDVYSRWAHARVSKKITTHRSLAFVRESQKLFPRMFSILQSDHGQEFSTWFTEHVQKAGYIHRHSRVRTPTDNGHLERFNRTIQDECFNRVPQSLLRYQKVLPEYLRYYNHERPHMGLNMKTPIEVIPSY